MRDILYRGKRKYGDTWYIGDFITDTKEFDRTCDGAYILPHWDKLNAPIEVDRTSVGQFTGMRDSKGARIFEQDIIEYSLCFKKYSGVVTYVDGTWQIVRRETVHNLHDILQCNNNAVVITNQYDEMVKLDEAIKNMK